MNHGRGNIKLAGFRMVVIITAMIIITARISAKAITIKMRIKALTGLPVMVVHKSHRPVHLCGQVSPNMCRPLQIR